MSDASRPHRSKLEQIARAQLSMTPGTIHGRVAQASPAASRSRQQNGSGEIVEAIFSYDGHPTLGDESPPYVNRSAGIEVGNVLVGSISSTSGPTVVSILKNGNSIGTVTLPGGTRQYGENTLDATLAYGDQLSVVVTSMDGNLDGLTIQVLLEE